MASTGYHEPIDELRDETRNLHRAIVSLMEELEAIDWHGQHADACSDQQLKDVLIHNRNEEIEHAAMVLEWIRRHDGHFDKMPRSGGPSMKQSFDNQKGAAGWILLWVLGIPIPILLAFFLLRGCT